MHVNLYVQVYMHMCVLVGKVPDLHLGCMCASDGAPDLHLGCMCVSRRAPGLKLGRICASGESACLTPSALSKGSVLGILQSQLGSRGWRIRSPRLWIHETLSSSKQANNYQTEPIKKKKVLGFGPFSEVCF